MSQIKDQKIKSQNIEGNNINETKMSCRNCNFREGNPFLCADCQWHVMDALHIASKRIERLIAE